MLYWDSVFIYFPPRHFETEMFLEPRNEILKNNNKSIGDLPHLDINLSEKKIYKTFEINGYIKAEASKTREVCLKYSREFICTQ